MPDRRSQPGVYTVHRDGQGARELGEVDGCAVVAMIGYSIPERWRRACGPDTKPSFFVGSGQVDLSGLASLR